MISGETNLRQQKSKFHQNLKLQQIALISRLYTKIHKFEQNSLEIPCKYTIITKKKKTVALHFFELLHKKSVKMRPKK